jgi:Flp pilus assembly protein TadD
MRFHSFLAVLVISPLTLADVVRLNDGTTLTGDIKKAADGWFVTDSHGKVTHVSQETVKSIELAPKGDPKDLAVGKLASLRRSVEALPDLKLIIDRYEKFIEQNKDLPNVAEEAKKDLALWKARQARGMVKVGSKWVDAAEKAQMQEKALLVADQARELLKQNKFKDADAAVSKALEVDPTNISALYLKGLILYRQDQVQPARKAFEAVKEIAPDHGPTLNNLAVVLWRQNQQMAAMNMYLQAMQAMPLNKELLNNVAEALNGLTPEQRKSPIAQKVYKLWTEQDNQLQQQMMPLGWYRWGSTWVDKVQFDKLQAAEKEVKEKIAKMEEDFADAQAKVDTIDAQMKQNHDAMRYMEQNRVVYDQTGKGTIYPLPPQYWDYDRANRRLDTQRKETVAQLDALRAKAQAVKQLLPVPKYSGIQIMIGVEGTPAVTPVAAGGAGAGPVANLKDEVSGGTGTTGTPPVNPLDTPKVPEKPEPVKDASKPGDAAKPPGGEKPLKY